MFRTKLMSSFGYYHHQPPLHLIPSSGLRTFWCLDLLQTTLGLSVLTGHCKCSHLSQSMFQINKLEAAPMSLKFEWVLQLQALPWMSMPMPMQMLLIKKLIWSCAWVEAIETQIFVPCFWGRMQRAVLLYYHYVWLSSNFFFRWFCSFLLFYQGLVF